MNYDEYFNRRNTLHNHNRLRLSHKLKSSKNWQKFMGKIEIK